jgi:hypothetical protein
LLTAQTTDVAEPWSAADIVSWRILTPTSTTVQAEHKTSPSIQPPFFDAAYFAIINAAGTSLIVCGPFPAPTLTQNVSNRFWTYTAPKPSTGPCTGPGVGANWYAIGVKGAAGLVTQGQP